MTHDTTQGATMQKRRRTCIACGKQADKAGLFRLVRTEGGGAAYDASGKQEGRGAYVCGAACLERAYRTKRIERALRTPITRQDYERIADSLSGSLPGSPAGAARTT